MAEWITARGERHKLTPDGGDMISMGTVCRIRFKAGEPTFPVLDRIPATLAPVCRTCDHHGNAPELITDQRHGLHTGTVTRYVTVTGKNGGRWHGAPLDAVQADRETGNGVQALCEGGPYVSVTDDATGSLVAYTPTDVVALDQDGERVKWCVGCSAVFKALKTPKPAATLKNTNPENVDRFGHTPDAGQKIENAAARIGRVVPMLGITPDHTPSDSVHSLPVSALVDLGGSANGKKVIHAGGAHATGSVELVCRDELITRGNWSRPQGEGDDTPKLTCSACRNALFINGPARSRQFKARVLAMLDGSQGNRPVGQTWGGTLWDNSQDPAKPADRFDVTRHGERAVRATRYDHGAATGQTLAGPGGTEAKTPMWSRHTVTLERGGNVVTLTLHRDIVHKMSGMYVTPSGIKLTGWEFYRTTGKLPAAIRYSMTPEMTRRLHNAKQTPAEKRAAEKARQEKARERAEYARNRARNTHNDVSAVQVRGDIYAGFLNRPGRVRDVAAHGR